MWMEASGTRIPGHTICKDGHGVGQRQQVIIWEGSEQGDRLRRVKEDGLNR